MRSVSIAVLLFIFILNEAGFSQVEKNWGEIGKPVPDFHITNIKNASVTELGNAELKGRFTILDFWNRYCSACIASFPKTNEIYLAYKDKIDFLLIGDEFNLEELFARYKEKWQLKFPYTYDPATFKQFVHTGVPYLVWIDSLGIIRAITTSNDLRKENIDSFLAGKEFVFRDQSFKASQILAKDYDVNKPFLVNGNGGADSMFDYRSLITKFRPGMPIRNFETSLHAYTPDVSMQLEGSAGLEILYTLAYFGKWGWSMEDSIYTQVYNKLLIESKDSLLFRKADFSSGENIFWYSLIVPKKHKNWSSLMKIMQTDMERFFGYKAVIENRFLPYYKITTSETVKKKIRSKGSKDISTEYPGGFNFCNVSMKELLTTLFFTAQNGVIPIIDETGIDFNIDLKVDVLTSDIRDIKRALHEKGINIEIGKKEFLTLVIYDK